jgi:mono/diheme cytochrome c family protein
MSPKAVSILVAGVATIALSHSAVVAYQAKPRTVWDGVYSEDQAKRGAPLYAEKCANCHGSELTGNDAPALVGSEFSANWSDLSLNDLSERIRVTMPADSPGSLSRPQVADIIAVILHRAEMPAGKEELPTQAEALKEIKYVGTKPAGAAAASSASPASASTSTNSPASTTGTSGTSSTGSTTDR